MVMIWHVDGISRWKVDLGSRLALGEDMAGSGR